MPDLVMIHDIVTRHICANRCMGIRGNYGGCCRIDERDFIMGPVVEDLGAGLIGFEEGSKLFPDRPTWQDPANYPAMRPDVTKPGNPCVYFDRGCTIYENRPETCRKFTCEALSSVLSSL